jgi:amidohydrolase
MIESIRAAVDQGRHATVRDRRHLHAHPELSFAEHGTARYVAEQLKAEGIEVREGVAGTGVIGLIKGRPGGGCICLRADIDALPIQERNDVPYRSLNAGVMHACGHDAHTAMVLGAGRALHALREHWSGTVLLLFQPGEEKIPGGASLVMKEDALRDPRPSAILGQHVTPELAVGKVGFREGPFMASSDELYLTVIGKGGHAAAPQHLVDPITITARLLLALKEEFARLYPEQPKVLAFGKVIADGATNVVPDEVRIAGTFRAFDEELRERIHGWLPERAQAICAAYGGRCDVEVRKGYPVLINDPALTARTRAAAEAYLGADKVVTMDQRMGSEDFAFYTHAMPGCFFRLGTGNVAKPHMTGLHTATFDLDEEALAIGTGVMAWGAIAELHG